jgi:hypothetical protein
MHTDTQAREVKQVQVCDHYKGGSGSPSLRLLLLLLLPPHPAAAAATATAIAAIAVTPWFPSSWLLWLFLAPVLSMARDDC